MGKIVPHWTDNDLNSLHIEQASNPSIGYDVIDGLDIKGYQSIISAGVYRNLPDFFKLDIFEKEFHWLSYKKYAVHKMLPYTMLPLHRDKYSYFISNHNVKDFDRIVRVIVFLQDFKLGHILQIEDTEVRQWRAGDYVYWFGKKEHLAANFGKEDRFTLQITGIIN